MPLSSTVSCQASCVVVKDTAIRPSRVEGSARRRRLFAVLHTPPIASPADAVRAAILRELSPGRNGDQISALPHLDYP